MQLGYLTPPVGLNLFIASYRFNKPIMHVYSATFPFLIILMLSVILITFLPECRCCSFLVTNETGVVLHRNLVVAVFLLAIAPSVCASLE